MLKKLVVVSAIAVMFLVGPAPSPLRAGDTHTAAALRPLRLGSQTITRPARSSSTGARTNGKSTRGRTNTIKRALQTMSAMGH